MGISFVEGSKQAGRSWCGKGWGDSLNARPACSQGVACAGCAEGGPKARGPGGGQSLTKAGVTSVLFRLIKEDKIANGL